jgi:hypothetical protein
VTFAVVVRCPRTRVRQISIVDAWGNAAAMTGSENGA